MNRGTLFIIILGFSFLHSQGQYGWRHRACLPAAPRVDQTSFTLGNKGYSLGGGTIDGTYLSEVWEYDPATDIWTQKNNFVYGITGAAVFVINDTAYVGLGSSYGSFQTGFYRYEQASDQWTALASFPGYGRYEAMSFTIGQYGYVGCGFDGGEFSDFYRYNPRTDSWDTMAIFPGEPCQSGVGVAVGNYGYVGLGLNSGTNLSQLYKYDPSANAWSALATFPPSSGKDDPGYFVLNDTIYAATGQEFMQSDFTDCWMYVPSTNEWTQLEGLECLALGRATFRGWTLNGHGYVMFGCQHSYTVYFNDLLEFGPVDTAFTQRVHVLGNDTGSCSQFSEVLTVSDSCAVWSTGYVGPSITVSAAGTYWVRMNDSCGVSADTVNIVPNGDSLFISQNKDTICGNDSIQICATPGFQTYQWNTGQTTSCIYTNLAGNYYLTATDPGGCTATSNRVSVAVYPVPPVEVSLTNDTFTCYNGLNIQWFYNGDTIPGATSNILIATQPGYYSVFIQDSDGCSEISEQVIYPATAIPNIELSSFNIYPNPLTSGNWTIAGDESIIGASAEIYDADGRLVYYSKITAARWLLELSPASGVYTLRINSAGKNLVKKLVKL